MMCFSGDLHFYFDDFEDVRYFIRRLSVARLFFFSIIQVYCNVLISVEYVKYNCQPYALPEVRVRSLKLSNAERGRVTIDDFS